MKTNTLTTRRSASLAVSPARSSRSGDAGTEKKIPWSHVADETIEKTEEKAPLSVTVNRRGEIVGDTSAIDPEILAQLQTPEAQAKIRDQYRSAHDCGGRRETRAVLRSRVRMLTHGERRDFRHLMPVGMGGKAAKQLRKKMFRDLKKQALRQQRRSYANQSLSDQHQGSVAGK